MNARTPSNRLSRAVAVAGIFLLSGLAQSATPIVNEIAKLLASDGAAGDTFGRSVDIDGDVAVIGAPPALSSIISNSALRLRN